MSSLTKFTQADGIEAACGGPRAALDFSFSLHTTEEEREQYKGVFQKMIELLALVPEQDELKITLDSKSLLLRRHSGLYIGVVAIKGHPVVKSLQRMVRRAFKKMGATDITPATPKPKPEPRTLGGYRSDGVPDPVSSAPTRPLEVPQDPDGFKKF